MPAAARPAAPGRRARPRRGPSAGVARGLVAAVPAADRGLQILVGIPPQVLWERLAAVAGALPLAALAAAAAAVLCQEVALPAALRCLAQPVQPGAPAGSCQATLHICKWATRQERRGARVSLGGQCRGHGASLADPCLGAPPPSARFAAPQGQVDGPGREASMAAWGQGQCGMSTAAVRAGC